MSLQNIAAGTRHGIVPIQKMQQKGSKKMKAPEYLHNPETCPCEGGRERGCPNNRHCDLCQANHHSKPNAPYTACEKKALAEFGTLDFD